MNTLLYYFTGKPCVNGHIANRRISSKSCVVCERERARKIARQQREKHKDRIASYAKEYGKRNRAALTAYSLNYVKQRRLRDKQYVLKQTLQGRARHAFRLLGKRRPRKTEDMLGCTIQEFAEHIEKQFLAGMTWENRNLWHIDHIIPCASAKSTDELQKLFHFTNLRPIWAKDNWAKKDQFHFLI